MPTPTVELKGADTAERMLAALRRPRLQRVFKAALRANAFRLQRTLTRRYLSGQVLPVITGELRDSPDFDLSTLPERVAVGTPHPGAAALNFGWPAKNIRARPFMAPALRALQADGFDKDWLRALDQEVPSR